MSSLSDRTPPVIIVLRALWRILTQKQRMAFVFLCFLLAVTAFMEMGGMIVLFGFVRGLELNAQGKRKGPVAHALDLVFDAPLSQLQFVIYGGIVVFGFMLVKNIQGTLVRFSIDRFLLKLNQRISESLYRAYMLAPYELFLEQGFKRPAKEISRLFGIFNSCFSSTVQLLSDSAMIITVLGLLFYLDWQLAGLSTVLFASVGVGIYSLLEKYLKNLGKEQEEADKTVGQYLKEGLEGLVEVRLRGTADHYFKSYNRALGRSTVLRRRKTAMSKLPRSGNELALGTLIVGATLYVTLQGQTIGEALPTLGVFGFAGLRMTGVLSRVNRAAQTLRRRAIQFEESYDQIVEIAPTAVGREARPSDHYLSTEKDFPPDRSGKLEHCIELRNVSFRYPGHQKLVLDNVSLTIKRGEFASFCGPSGGGKSTILLLLMGMMRPTSGEILFDGLSVTDHPRVWHKNIGYVRQNMFLVGRSIRDNVAFGIDPELVDDERVWTALRMASAEDFVNELPEGILSRLQDGGGNVSGGQKQRLMIARALYEDREVIVLDEATSALDNITEREVTDAIGRLHGSRTVICVAHRLSTIEDSDRIYMLKNGKIVAQGTYTELLENDADFQELALAAEDKPQDNPKDKHSELLADETWDNLDE